MATKKDSKSEPVLYCSFCGKSQHEVKKLVAGPDVYICDECTLLCMDIVKDGEAPIKAPSLENLPTPKEIVAQLDLHVIGQDEPKNVLAVAAYHHYRRLKAGGKDKDGVEIKKANLLLIGPTGVGKTLLIEKLASILRVPFAMQNMTGVTQAGWVGADIEEVFGRLYDAAGGDVSKAEFGVVALDELDKIAGKSDFSNTRDISGKGVQHGLLKPLEAEVVEIAIGDGPKMMREKILINTRNILFVAMGAFDELEKIIAKRLREGKSGIGFRAILFAGNDAKVPKSLMDQVTVEDLEEFGLDTQLIGRLPRVAVLHEHTEESLVRILTEPQNALLRQYAKLLAMDGATLECDPDAVVEIARHALATKTGARALDAICGKIFHSTFLTLPTLQKSGAKIAKVHLTAQHVREGLPPNLIPANQKLLK